MAEQNETNSISIQPDIDLGKVFDIILNGKWLIIFLTTVFAIVGFVKAIKDNPVYRGDALIQIEEKKSGMPGFGDMDDMFSVDSSAKTEMELIKSRSVMGNAVDLVQLDIVAFPNRMPYFGNYFARKNGPDQVASPKFGMPEYAWGGEQINVTTLEVAKSLIGMPLKLLAEGNSNYSVWLGDEKLLSGKVGERLESDEITLVVSDLVARAETTFTIFRAKRANIIRNLQNTLGIFEKSKNSGMLKLSLDGGDPELIEKTLNSVASFYHLQNVQRSAAEAEQGLKFLQEQLPALKEELTQAEERLHQYRLEHKSIDLTMETQSVLAQSIELETQLSQMSLTEAEISQRFTSEHPHYKAFHRQKKELLRRIDKLSAEVMELPETQQEVLRLKRDLEVTQQIYLELQGRAQELNVAKAGTIGNVRIIDDAEVNDVPIGPHRLSILLMHTGLGFAISIGLIFLRAALNQGVKSPEDLARTGIPVYGSIPFSSRHTLDIDLRRKSRNSIKSKKSLLLAELDPTDLAIEGLRSIRTSLHFAMLESKNNVLMVAGSGPGIGKSFVASNLASIMAQSGKKVLLIDADMRKGYLQRVFRFSNDNGLSDILANDISLEDAIKSTEVEGLHLITRGTVPPNPSELLMSKRFEQLVKQVSSEYDLVLFDTPPVLAVTEPNIIGHHCGTNILIARFDKTPLKEVEAAINRFEQNGVEIRGIILNGIEKRTGGYEYGNYNYEYKSVKA